MWMQPSTRLAQNGVQSRYRVVYYERYPALDITATRLGLPALPRHLWQKASVDPVVAWPWKTSVMALGCLGFTLTGSSLTFKGAPRNDTTAVR
jgi:hypothetical protein